MFSAKRLPSAPDVPTMAEAGGPPMESSTWLLFLAPAGTPREIVTRMSAEVAKSVNASEVKGKLEAMGIDPVGSTPEQAGRFLNDEIARWAKVIQVAGVKAEQ
jgi:tripartite-type tricarboxylate transporter receptor subunit TctC